MRPREVRAKGRHEWADGGGAAANGLMRDGRGAPAGGLVWDGRVAPAGGHRRVGRTAGRARLTDVRQASCPGTRPARARGWHGAASRSARTAGACKTARANPGTLCSSAAKKTRLCIFGARVARNTGVCMLISYKVLRFLLKHLRFRRIRLHQHCLNRANPGSSCRKKAFHANPSIYCEVPAGNLGLCIFQPLLGPPASHPMQTPHLIAKQMQEAAYSASSNPLMPSSNSPSLQTASFIA